MKDQKKSLVTIITACYKKLDFLKQTIDSVLNQDYEKMEYIITDDGTPDFKEDYYREYINRNKNKNIQNFIVLSHKENQGTVKNYNDAIKKANGKYIVFLDGDDVFFCSDVISKIIERMEKSKAYVLLTKRIVCNDDLNPIGEIPQKKEERKITKMNTALKQYKAHLNNHIYGVASSAVLSVDIKVFKTYGIYDERYVLLEDAPFFAKILKNNIKIEMDFSIISIYYRDSGVSNVPTDITINRKYMNDCLLYMKNEYKNAQNILNWFERYLFNSYLNFFLASKPTKWVHIKYLGAIFYYRTLNYIYKAQKR